MSRVHELEKQLHIKANKKEFGQWYSSMKWADEAFLSQLSEQRKELISLIKENDAHFGYNNTKTDTRKLSPGCRICAEGEWSCLFINNKCNAACFYCPSAQNEISEPSTQTFTFAEPESYIAYLERFGFKGASLSGGEPFLTFEKTLNFVKAIKKNFGQKLHLWLYTNGILADETKLDLLAEAGLDEIRFDIGATAYSLSKVAMAVGRIPVVTVEIPAVDLEKLKAVCKDLADIGVNHLNLHQLRATPYNVERLMKKGFYFLHGPKVLVAESEVIALKCINYVLNNKIQLPVNYCSFVFKNSHQNRSARIRAGVEMVKPYEEFTRAGFLRSLFVKAEPEELAVLHIELKNMKQLPVGAEFLYMNNADSLYFNTSLLSFFYNKGMDVFLSYSYVTMRGYLSYQNPFKELRADKKKVFIEKISVLRPQKVENTLYLFLQIIAALSSEQDFLQAIFKYNPDEAENENLNTELLLRIKELEYMKEGLQEYYL